MPIITSVDPPSGLKLYKSFKEQLYTDITLIAHNGYKIEAHKVILVMASPYLKDIIEVVDKNHPAIVLAGVSQKSLQLMLDFIYCGRVNVDDFDVQAFLKLLKDMQIKSKICETANEVILSSSEEILIEEDLSIGNGKSATKEVKVQKKTEENQGGSEIVVMRKSNNPPKFVRVVPKFPCKFCWMEIKTPGHLPTRNCWKQPNRVITTCGLCQKPFCDPFYVKRHMKIVHGNEKL